jgi:hypothetical protein
MERRAEARLNALHQLMNSMMMMISQIGMPRKKRPRALNMECLL